MEVLQKIKSRTTIYYKMQQAGAVAQFRVFMVNQVHRQEG